MEVADVKRLKALELENSRLKKLLAERDLDIEVSATAGLKDTLLRREVKPAVVYGNEKAVQPRVKLEAVRLLAERGVSAAQAAKDLKVHENVLRKWVRRPRPTRSTHFLAKV